MSSLNTLRITESWNDCQNSENVNSVEYLFGTTILTSAAPAFLAACMTAWLTGPAYSAWYDVMNENVSKLATAMVLVDGSNVGHGLEDNSDLGVPGNITGDPAPPNVCLIISKLTTLIGKPYRGYIAVGGLTLADVVAGNITGSTLTGAVSLAVALSATFTVSGNVGKPCIMHRSPSILPPTLVSAYATRPFTRTRRSRNVGKGV